MIDVSENKGPMSLGLRLFLAAVLFLSSAGGLVVEIVAGRLIAPYVGMSLYTWTAIIAVVLAGLSVGHWIGGLMAGPGTGRRDAFGRLAGALALAGASSLLALVLLNDLAVGLLSSGLGQVAIVVVLTTALFLLPSLFVGMVAPVVTKLSIDANPNRTGAVIGTMYAVGTVGSIFGTLSAGYLFISWIGSSGTLIAVTVLYGVLAIACALLAGRRPALIAAVSIIVLGLPLAGTGVARGAFSSRCTVESDYFCIVIDDFSPYSSRPSKLMVLDNLVHSINDKADPSLLYSPYIQFVDEYTRSRLADGPARRGLTAFFIGGGAYTLPRSWAATIPRARLTVAEIDPVVTETAARHMWVNPDHPAFDIRHQDARALLQSLPEVPAFHVVFGDAFHDISIPTHLVSRAFNREVATRLMPEGFYVLNVVDAATGPRLVASITATLKLDYDVVEVWTEDLSAAEGGPPNDRNTYVIVAGDKPSAGNVMRSVFGIERTWRQVPVNRIHAEAGGNPVILTDDFAPVDRLISEGLFGAVKSSD